MQACGGGGSGDSDIGANRLHVNLQDCAFLLDLGVTADIINESGSCIFIEEDGSTGFASIDGGENNLNPDLDDSDFLPDNDDGTIDVIDPDLLSGDVPQDPMLADVPGSDFFQALIIQPLLTAPLSVRVWSTIHCSDALFLSRFNQQKMVYLWSTSTHWKMVNVPPPWH